MTIDLHPSTPEKTVNYSFKNSAYQPNTYFSRQDGMASSAMSPGYAAMYACCFSTLPERLSKLGSENSAAYELKALISESALRSLGQAEVI